MDQDVKKRSETRSTTNSNNNNQSLTRKVEDKVEQLQNEWSYERIIKVGAAVVTILGVILNKNAYRKIEEFGESVAAILGVESIQDWEPPKELLKRLGLKTEAELRHS